MRLARSAKVVASRKCHMHTTAHAHGMVGRFRHNQKPFHDATTEKRRKVKFLFFFSFSSPDPLMCPTDSETGFGHRHHRFGLERVDHGGRQTLGSGREGGGLRWKWNERQMSLFCFHDGHESNTDRPQRHNNNNNRSGAPKQNRNLVRRSAFGFRLPY